jgi:hypothetical protein
MTKLHISTDDTVLCKIYFCLNQKQEFSSFILMTDKTDNYSIPVLTLEKYKCFSMFFTVNAAKQTKQME